MNASGSATGSSTSAATVGSDLTVTIDGTALSVAADAGGRFQFVGVPAGDVQLRFSGVNVNAMMVISNVSEGEEIEVEVTVNRDSAVVLKEVRTGKVALCHRSDNGYHRIEVSTSAEPAHRAHGDGEVGDPVPGTLTKVFDDACQPRGLGVSLEKSTNGQDADNGPGPSVPVDDPVTWTYVVTNTSTAPLTNVVVVDDQLVVADCSGQTTLAVGESMTCTASGGAVLGPYQNIGTVTAASSTGPVADSDPSHYTGVATDQTEHEEPGEKVQLCHRTGNGRYHLIEVSVNAEPAHRAHGDGKVGEVVPGGRGEVFLPGCTVSATAQ